MRVALHIVVEAEGNNRFCKFRRSGRRSYGSGAFPRRGHVEDGWRQVFEVTGLATIRDRLGKPDYWSECASSEVAAKALLSRLGMA
jgi:hypothetical protein